MPSSSTLRPGHLLFVIVALATGFKCLLLVRHGFDFSYPYMFADSHDWVANGLCHAGHPVRCSMRPPALPLLIAALERLGLLASLPLFNQAALVGLVAALNRFLRRHLGGWSAAIACLLLFLGFFLQDFAYYIMADLYAALLMVLSLDHFIEARRQPRRYLWAALYLGLSSLFQYAALVTLAPAYLVVVVLLRRDHLRLRPVHLAALVAAVPSAAWCGYRWARYGDPLHSEVKHLDLIAPHLDGLPFYLLNLISVLSIPVFVLLLFGLTGARHVEEDDRRAALTLLIVGLANMLFWVLLYQWNDRRFLVYWIAPLFFFIGRAVEIMRVGLAARSRGWRVALLAGLVIVLFHVQIGYPSPLSGDRVALTPIHFLRAGARADGQGGQHIDLSAISVETAAPPSGWLSLLNPVRRLSAAEADPVLKRLHRELLTLRARLEPEPPGALLYLSDDPPWVRNITCNRFGNVLRRELVSTRRPSTAAPGVLLLARGAIAPPPQHFRLLAEGPSLRLYRRRPIIGP